MIDSFIRQYDMLPEGSSVLCAVSGGADSMCLLHWLWTNAERLHIKVYAAHFDHQLRGLESARDRTFVKNWCRERNIPLEIGFGKVREYAGNNGLGLEEAARKLRYDFLEKTADKFECTRIATAHNEDDNAETVLFNLARGTGTAGLSGIPPVRGRIIRPILCMTRSEILSYLEVNGIEHVEDSTNESDDYSRNKIRHNIMPVLREMNPSVSKNIMRTSQLLRKDNEFFEKEADRFIEADAHDGFISAESLAKLPEQTAARVIRKMAPVSIQKEHVDAVMRLLDLKAPAYADIPGIRVEREREGLRFGVPLNSQITDSVITPGEILEIPEAGLEIKSDIIEEISEINSSLNTFYFKFDNICGNIFCTHRRDGDKIRLTGRGCTKSLKDLFNENRITQSRRPLIPVIRDDKGIIGVYGFGTAERCRPEKGDRVLRIKIEETGEKKPGG